MTVTMTPAEVDQLKRSPAPQEILAEIRNRWSPRSFSDRPVSPHDLKLVFEAARWAASSYNEQPWRFLVGQRGSETYQKILSVLMEFNQLWARTAPVLILDATRTKFSHNGSDNAVALYDAGAAAASLCYQATALGLYTHQMAGVNRDAARSVFNIPAEFVVGAAIALGYQGEPSALTVPQMLEQEVAPRQRKALSEIVFSEWEKPAVL